MLESIVTDPEGNEFIVTHPEGASQKDIIDFFAQSNALQPSAPGTMDAPDNFAVDFLKGLFTGGGQATVSSAAGLTQWAGQTFNNNSMLDAAEDMRQYSQGIGESIGLDRDFQGSFIGQVTQGLGQVPITIGAGMAGFAVGGPPGALAAAALTTGGQMTSEFLTDMEQSVGKQYTDFDEAEKSAALKGMLAQTALGTTLELVAVGKAVRPLIRKLNNGKGVSSKALREAIERDKGALREIAESGFAEGFTEASQGQSLDTLASLLYDEDRELMTMNTLKRRSLEFGVGAVVGSTVSGGSQVLGSPGKNSTTEKDLDKPVENRSEVPVPRDIEVTYKPVDGPPVTVTLSIGQDEDALTAAQEILGGRRLPGGDISVTEIIPETPIDVVLGEEKDDVLEEDVPVDPVPVEQAPEGEGTPIPAQRDYRNVKVGDTFEIVGINGKTSQVEAVGISDESGMIRFKREDGTFGVTGNERDSVFQDINSPDYYMQAAGHGTQGKLIKDLSAEELDALEASINKKFESDPYLKQGIQGAGRSNVSDLNAIKLERRRRGQAPTAPTPAPTPAPEPSVETAPEPTPSTDPTIGKTVAELAQEVGITEQQFRETYPDLSRRADERARSTEAEVDPMTGLPGFSLPKNLRSGKPKYQQSGPIKFASDLERAAYSATTTTRSEPGKRKRESYRKLLEDAGYTSAEINAMGREIRSQMRDQYKGPGSELSVALPQDIVADASATYIPKRFVGEQADKAPPFFQSFSPEQYDEGRFVNLETKQDLSDQTFEGGSIRIEGGRPMLETSDNSSQTILNSKASEEGPLVRTNLFKQKAGWKWTEAPEGAPSTIVSVEQGSKHYYTLDFSSSKPLTLKTYPDKKSEPRGRPTTRGKVKLGNPVGEISIRGKKHTVYDQVTVGEDVVAQADPAQTSVSSVSTAQDSSRVGTARNPKEETSQDSNIDVSMVPEDTLEKHMRIMDYGHLPKDIRDEKDTKVKYEKLVNFMKENLLSLHNAFPDELRARATQWYDGANKIANGFSKRYDITVEQSSGILAVLSPQKDWFMNVAQAEQVIHIWRNYQDVRIEGTEYDAMIEEIIDTAEAPIKQKKKKLVNETPEQEKRRQNYNRKLDQKAKDNRRAVLDQIKGKTVRELSQDSSPAGQTVMAWAIRTTAQVQFGRNYSVVTPEGDFGGPSLKMDGQPATNGWGSTGEIVKAVSIIEDGSIQNISDRLGSEHKVRNFYNNIVAPNSPYGDATMDTHAVAAALLMPLGSSATQVSDNFGSGKAGKTSKSGQTVSGTYYVYLDAYRRAAKEVGLQPRQMQSITWEAIRQVYLPQDRKPEFVKQRTKEWNQYKDEKEARQQIIGETINAPEWAGTRPSGQPGGGATSVQVDGDGSIIGGDLLFRGGSDIIGVPGNSTQITVPAGNRLRLYSGTVSYRSGSSKNSGRSEKTFKGISRVNAKDFVEIASRNKRNHKFGSSVDVFKAKDYKGYHLIVAKGKGRAYVTVAISPSGEVSSVTASKSATKADVNAAFDLAIASGAVRWLNGFDTVLGDIYAFYGFEPVARLPFDTDQAPPDWSYNRYSEFKDGKPDLLFMKFNGQMNRKLSDYPDPGYAPSYNEAVELATEGDDVTAQAAETAAEDRGPQEAFDNINQLEDFVSKSFDAIANKLGISIRPNMIGQFVAQYNVTQKIIEYNPRALLNRTKAGVQAAMREEIIHAAMHSVLIQKEKKARTGRSEDALWVDFFTALGNNLTPQERTEIQNVYQSLREGDTVGFGSEYSRAVVQKFRYGDFTEQYVAVDKGGPAFQAIVDLLRSVQAYMAKVLGPMVKTDPEAAQVIVDTVDLLNAIDPAIRPKSQQVVANAYDAVDKNAAEESAQPGESADAKASERIREERKWWADTAARQTASKYLTPVITRLNRINPMFGRILQNLDTAIRERSFKNRKQTEAFFNKLNAIKGEQFLELKQLLYFSPTPDEANLPKNKAILQRRDALLHKYGLLNMYRLDIQPIMEAIYAEYTKLGMPAMGYLEEYFPRVVKDLEGLIKSYGQKTKRTFELLVDEENKRRSKLTKDGLPAPLPAMEKTELARFFQDFLQNKFRVDINGVKLPGNVKARERTLIPRSKLKFYDDPGIAFGKYTANMNRAIESFKVVGDTRKGEGRLQGKLGKLTEELFSAGQIDLADADELKTLTELVTSQFQNENEILKSLGTITYMLTLINPGPVLVQIMDLYKVALYRGLGGVVSGTYRTVTGNRRFDLEKDFSIAKTQLSAEFEDPSFLQKALDFGLSRLVPFRQMDVSMKHASIEAAFDDFVKKAKSPVGSKKYEQLLNELTITMGRQDALKTIEDLRLDNAKDSILVKEALLSELLQRQPLTYLQVPEGYQTNPKSRLFYKLSTFMLLDLNYNRQEFMNDLGGPGRTLKQRTVALRRLAYMATLLTMFGMPSDLLDDWIAGKDTYIPEHVMNNILGMFGFSRYTTTRILEKGPVDAAIQRFTPPVVNIMSQGFLDFRSWVKGDVELFDLKSWRNSPLSDVWWNRVGGGEASQERLRKERAKEGIFPDIYR